jgi:hypothetical protein
VVGGWGGLGGLRGGRLLIRRGMGGGLALVGERVDANGGSGGPYL